MADYMALPIVQAAKQAGCEVGGDDGLIVTSSNCFKVGIDAIKAGELYGTATEDPGTIAEADRRLRRAVLQRREPAAERDRRGGPGHRGERRRVRRAVQPGMTRHLATRPRELVRVEGLARSFGGVPAVRDVSFTVGAGEIHAAVRAQRRRQEHRGQDAVRPARRPTTGRILHRRRCRSTCAAGRSAQRLGVALVDQELSVVPALTVLENMHARRHRGPAGQPPTCRRSRGVAGARRHGSRADRPGPAAVDARASASASWSRSRKALGQDARLVILDEPTATLSDVESECVFAAVRRVAAGGCAVVFVSHRLGRCCDLCDTVTVLRDGDVVATTPAADLTVDALIVQMLGEAPHRLEAARRADGDRAQALRRRRAARARPARRTSRSPRGPAGSTPLAGQLGSRRLRRAARGRRAAPAGHRHACTVRRRHGPSRRSGRAAARAGIAFVSNDRKSEGLFLDKTIAAGTCSRPGSPRLDPGSACCRAGRRLVGDRWPSSSSCAAGASSADPPCAALSGGNQQKVFVGRCLGRDDVRVLLLDEPTRGVDIGGRAAIHHLLREAADGGVVVLFSSTELEELLDLGDVIVTMHEGVAVQRHEGDDRRARS